MKTLAIASFLLAAYVPSCGSPQSYEDCLKSTYGTADREEIQEILWAQGWSNEAITDAIEACRPNTAKPANGVYFGR